MDIKSLQAAIDSLRPVTFVEVTRGVTIGVGEVRVRDISDFVDALSKVIPSVARAVAVDQLNGGDGRTFLLQMAPMIAKDLKNLIDATVSPAGAFSILPYDLAAPVLTAWIERNILDEGKFRAWEQEIAALKSRLAPLAERLTHLTSSSASSDSSETASASTKS